MMSEEKYVFGKKQNQKTTDDLYTSWNDFAFRL